MSAPPIQPRVIVCELCHGRPEGRIPTDSARARIDAIDHGLDLHRAQILSSPSSASRWFRICLPTPCASNPSPRPRKPPEGGVGDLVPA